MTPRYLIEQAFRALKNNQMQDLEHILGVLSEMMVTTAQITATPETLIECAKCHDTAAPEYRLRRVMGRYALLCYRGGDDCWTRVARPDCAYKDEQGVGCPNPAEVTLAYGNDQAVVQHVCGLHVAAFLSPVSGSMHLYPIEI